MRKHVKAQLLESVEYLVQTSDNLETLLRGLGRNAAVDVLAQMQQLVIQVGNTIEDSEGSTHAVISKLENVCEVLYQLSCSLGQKKRGRHLFQELKGSIAEIKTEIIDNIPVRLEILFVPYQVSMWDSLESVWMAARDEETVDSFVVPIPFYDVRPDNSLGSMHYEGDRYPDYVPVIPYWDYSIEDRRPDMIFFHNPYDENNKVTRVPESYYAKNMKRYTDLLVYIPYFISEEGGLSNHQCYTNGVLFADRVVVQPGSNYNQYCKIYTEVLKQNKLERVLVPAEKKFLPLGSPKLDKLRNTECRIDDLPTAWKKKIVKADGTRKKIIFYNLSIVPLLVNGEQILKKIDSVFSFFEAKRKDAVLLWRPHPLLIHTITSMVPWMKEAYMQRVRKFKEEGWGIYDDTADSNLALVLSDAYYGDDSSLLTSYRETEKPILLQEFQITELDECPKILSLQQVQRECECSLACFYDAVSMSHSREKKQSDIGLNILRVLLEQIKGA